jgi:putative protein kinase ArgK-like GTPase of G3E family
MTTENNEIVVAQNQVELVKSENADYVVIQGADGKFSRKAKFNEFNSLKLETRAEKMWYLNLLEGNEENGNGLKEHVGQIIEVQDVITRRYDKINEDTGATEYSVLTYLVAPDKQVFVTSSKTVYFTIMRTFEAFGFPGTPEWENLKLKVAKQKGQNGDIIKVIPMP